MTTTEARPFRFGVINESLTTLARWRETVTRAEDVGASTFLIRDHVATEPFGAQLGPVSALAAAAMITERIRLGTMVIGNDYRNPALLAQEAASIDFLSSGRFELGMGAGWQSDEYRALGIPFDAAGRRIERLAQSVDIVDGLLRGESVTSAGGNYRLEDCRLGLPPIRRPRPPILIAGGGPRMLALAGEKADIVGILPAPILDVNGAESPADRLPAAFANKIATIRQAAGARFPRVELSVFATVRTTGNRRGDTEALIHERGWDGLACEDVWQMPTVLIGSPEQIAADLHQRREQFGISYFVVPDSALDQIAPVIARIGR
jgi:probable F420-dependent oxidoreductase